MSIVCPVSICSGGFHPRDSSAEWFITSTIYSRQSNHTLGVTFRQFMYHLWHHLMCFQQCSAQVRDLLQAKVTQSYLTKQGTKQHEHFRIVSSESQLFCLERPSIFVRNRFHPIPMNFRHANQKQNIIYAIRRTYSTKRIENHQHHLVSVI